ncbi:MAG: hypothetical protein WKF37_02410 [Bryobacteraceae bacterium]
MNWIRTFSIGLALTVSGASFQEQGRNTVKILSASPGTEKPLQVGETVAFRIEVEYSLATADSGSITLVIQRGESGHASLANETEVVRKGRGKVVLSKEVVVPETGALQVFTPLSVQGGTNTRVVDTRSYKVVKK